MNDVIRRSDVAMLAKVRKMVEVNDGVLGGTPRFRGTRIPIHDIAAALRRRFTIATRNEADFAAVGVDLLNRRKD